MLGYYLVYPFLVLLCRLPFRVLYLISDFLYLVVYHGFGYRKKVVISNLKNAFPEKSEFEILQITKRFYRYFCDLVVETIRKSGMTNAEVLRHSPIVNCPEVEAIFEKQGSAVFMMGHYGNWEWASNHFSLIGKMKLVAIYKTLSNKGFDNWMFQMRSKFGVVPVKMENTLREVVARKNQPTAFAFVADQTPIPPISLWLPFLNQDTAVFTGAEKIARKTGLPVFFVTVRREKRGKYVIGQELLSADPKALPENELTHLFFQRLEREILANPEFWLWSHRRWKHQR